MWKQVLHTTIFGKTLKQLIALSKVFLAYVEFILITSSILKSENT